MKGIDWDCLAKQLEDEVDEEDFDYMREAYATNKELCIAYLGDMHESFLEFMIESYRQYAPEVCREFE